MQEGPPSGFKRQRTKGGEEDERKRKKEGRKEGSSDVRTGHNSRIMRRFIRAYVSEP